MVDLKSKRSETAKQKKRKTKQKLEEETAAKSSKRHRLSFSELASEPRRFEGITVTDETVELFSNHGFEGGSTWKNLELILFIENKGIDVHKKVELAYDFVTSKEKQGSDNDGDEDCKTVKMSRVVVFLHDWVQSLLVSSKKRIGITGESDISITGTYLDARCWRIFKFCLEESLKFKASLSFSKNILESIRFFAEDTLAELSKMSSCDHKEFGLHRTVLDCIDLVFSSHGGLSNESLGLWISTVNAVVELVYRVHGERLSDGNAGLYVLQLSCAVLEPFAKFLRANPTHKKNGFHDFVYKLLEPLLNLLGVLHYQVGVGFQEWKSKLLKLTEGVLSYGLFHSVQIDGFFGLNSTEKYADSHGENGMYPKTVIKSYHRHLFAKLEEVVAAKKELASCSIGKLIPLLAARVKNLKGALVTSERMKVTRTTEYTQTSVSVVPALGKSTSLTHLTADKRKSLFDVFVLITEPLLLEINGYLQLDHGVGLVLSDVNCSLKSINSLLASLMHENIYLRTEDTSDGACVNFLKKVYESTMSLLSTLIRASRCEIHDKTKMEILASSAKEVLVAVGYLLEVEYNVVEGDLTSLWHMMLSCLTLEISLTSEADQSLLSCKVADLGGQLFDLYGQLRQVNNALIPLCKATRLLILHDSDNDVNPGKYSNPMREKAYAKAVGTLLCSEGFKLAVHKAIKSIPEGQASACLQQLLKDISETLKWMKPSNDESDEKKVGKLNLEDRFDLQAELLGRGLSELYGLVLSSLTVTTGNSFLVGKSIKDLVTVLGPCLSSLVELQPDVVKKFLYSVAGSCIYNDLKGFRFSTHWVFVFFFQLHMSCRVLYRQAASLMPPDSSKKISEAMSDSFMTFSGQDWTQKTDWKNDGYFACVSQPSASLGVVARAVSEIYVQDRDVECSPLIYVMNAMALQRLLDLNRHIKALDYLLQKNECLVQSGLLEENDLLRYHRKSKKLNRRISALREEAADLTGFMMEYLSIFSKNLQPMSAIGDSPHEESWDLSVSSLNKKSLPTAIWWILCQNIDVWSIHAAKKKLKTFLSLLVRSSIPFGVSSFGQIEKYYSYETNQPNRITMWKISIELFNNSILYEQRFVCRYLASRFCRAMEEYASTFTNSSSGNLDLVSPPDWVEVLSDLDNALLTVSSDKNATNDKESKASALLSLGISASQSLLTLLSWIPKDFFSSKAFSLLLTSVLNLERLVIGSLVDCQDAQYSHRVQELFRLFMSCRKVLKYIIMTSCNGKIEFIQTALSHMCSESSLPIVWLLKSLFVVVGIQSSVSKEGVTQADDTFFSLLDHTLYVLLTLNKYNLDHALSSFSDFQGSQKEEEIDRMKRKQRGDKFSKCVLCVSEFFMGQMESSVVLLKEAIRAEKVGFGCNIENLNIYSSTVACFSGFLWGLLSVIKQTDVRTDYQRVVSELKDKHDSEFNRCINVFEKLSSLLLCMLFLNDSKCFEKENKSNNKDNNDGMLIVCSKKFKSRGSDYVSGFLTGVDSLDEELPLNKDFLRNLLRGENPEAAFLLRQLFIASSAVIGLNLPVNCAPLSAKLMQTFTEISQTLLLEFVDNDNVQEPFSFIWLDGVVKYLEELGNHFPMTDPTLSRNLYIKIVELHLRAIGKCISYEGKRATLESHETESSTKSQVSGTPSKLRGLDEFKSRLRMSFTVFIKKSSELHLLSAIQAMERALAGVRERSAMIYDIQSGSERGGRVSSSVAAGIDCLDLLLESVSGGRRLNVVKRHIQSMIASAFNIIVHLQTPSIFYEQSVGKEPDPGAVILMCVEVLKRISGKHTLFQMEAWHVAQSLRIPGSLFQDFHRLKLSETSHQNGDQICAVDSRFSVDLFAACCRLLYNVLKHHKSELKGCLAVLDASVSTLLHCLETMDSDSKARNGYYSWEVEEAVQCAFCLRRIYEEIRHQKEILGRHCAQFLSNYIWVYSGNGPLKTGIKREIDEALRPGVYALIDACSPADLQHLHTIFGEGPCRTNLAALQHDYKLNFQYEGKV